MSNRQVSRKGSFFPNMFGEALQFPLANEAVRKTERERTEDDVDDGTKALDSKWREQRECNSVATKLDEGPASEAKNVAGEKINQKIQRKSI